MNTVYGLYRLPKWGPFQQLEFISTSGEALRQLIRSNLCDILHCD